MKKILLAMVLAVLLIPSAAFAENWQNIPNQGDNPVYYDYDSITEPEGTYGIIEVSLMRYLSASEGQAYKVNGEVPDVIWVKMHINGIERYIEPIEIELMDSKADFKIIDKAKPSFVFKGVYKSAIDDVEIAPVEDNAIWGIEDLLVEIYTNHPEFKSE